MGTLGCINDMMRRDKENRELRKRNKERLYETRDKLLKVGKNTDTPDISIEELERIRKNIEEKEKLDRKKLFQLTLLFLVLGIIAVIILWIVVA